MLNMKKIVTSILLGCLIVSAFAGCSSAGEESSTVTGSIVIEESEKASSAASAEESSQDKTSSAQESQQESSRENQQESDASENAEESSTAESTDESSTAESSVQTVQTSEQSADESSKAAAQETSERPIQTSAAEPSEQTEPSAASAPDVISQPSAGFSDSDIAFVYNNASVRPTDNMSDVIAKIGEASNVASAPSCIGVGEDKIYSYGDFKIESYPDAAGEKVLNIVIEGNTVATSKGVTVGMTAEDIKNAYGTDRLDSSSDEFIYTYFSGNMHLDFLLEGGKIIEIDYVFDI